MIKTFFVQAKSLLCSENDAFPDNGTENSARREIETALYAGDPPIQKKGFCFDTGFNQLKAYVFRKK